MVESEISSIIMIDAIQVENYFLIQAMKLTLEDLLILQRQEIIEVGDYEYEFKYADRSRLHQFFDKRGTKDDILMTKNGLITDTSYANVALYKKGKWYTPKHPLLKGSSRKRLLEKGKILESDIHINQLQEYNSITIFNSMIPFQKIVLKV